MIRIDENEFVQMRRECFNRGFLIGAATVVIFAVVAAFALSFLFPAW